MAYQGKVKAGDLYGSLYVITIFYSTGSRCRPMALCWCREYLTYGIFQAETLLDGRSKSAIRSKGRKLPEGTIVDPDMEFFLRDFGSWTFSKGYLKTATAPWMKMHRLIYETITQLKIPDSMQIDHINMNRADNRFSNLRVASNRQNTLNTEKRINTSSKYKGVDYCYTSCKWRARFAAKHIGWYFTQEEAYLARQNYIESKHPEDLEYLRT